ncbi:MAG: MarR family transcriptional regulator [Syntrophomonas sp.]|nr:MarR family transcriptional regulator [Syntrophomonas sp.]
MSRLWNARCSQYGVTAAQSFVIFDVRDHEGTSVKDIGIRIELDSSAITGLIDRLEKEDLVERKDDPNDRRGTKIFLTDKGRDLAESKLVPEAVEFNKYIRGMVEPEIAGIFQHSLNLLDKEINKVSM